MVVVVLNEVMLLVLVDTTVTVRVSVSVKVMEKTVTVVELLGVQIVSLTASARNKCAPSVGVGISRSRLAFTERVDSAKHKVKRRAPTLPKRSICLLGGITALLVALSLSRILPSPTRQ